MPKGLEGFGESYNDPEELDLEEKEKEEEEEGDEDPFEKEVPYEKMDDDEENW